MYNPFGDPIARVLPDNGITKVQAGSAQVKCRVMAQWKRVASD